ncbi:ABC transporter ATP-binding protein [Aliagarivorans taiwanensis]|uniref:ABC transporter ATP-binding protein n=1 Tax=Aliagarivorans taiwanensis TaxID=561966 RepID=UPI0004175050|nr:ABC transporter ATP-binding protein [Aliagarivorans taiwanensis]
MAETQSPVVLSVADLSVSFKQGASVKTVVKAMSFDVLAGETLAVVGESGSGKSVMSRALLGLLPAGSADVSGQAMLSKQGEQVELLSLSDQSLRKVRGNHIAMIFQEPMTALTPVLSIGEQLMEGILTHQPLSRSEAFELAVSMLQEARIPEARKRMAQYPHQLSGGMRQRVMIAMALACRPRILIADEPTTALDVTVQAQILKLINTLKTQYNTAVMLITHDMGVVAEAADRVLVMRRGDFVEAGSVQQVFSKPKQAYTQTLLASVPKLGSSAKQPIATIAENDAAVPLFDVADLCVQFDVREGLFNRVRSRVHAVEQVSLKLFPGETLALVGESGSGKSTLGRALLNLVPSSAGAIRFRGRDITGWSASMMRPLRKQIQMIFQDPFASLNPRKTVGALVEEPLKLFDICSDSERKQRVGELFERVGLSADDMTRYPHQFSGGQRQRICIARAIACEPRVIVADECLSALDVTVQAQVIELLQSLQQELGISLLFISHDLAVVEQISDRVAVMYMGRIVEMGDTARVINRPQHSYTQRLLEAVPVADPTKASLLNRPLNNSEIPSPVRSIFEEIPRHNMTNITSIGEHYVADDSAAVAPSDVTEDVA